MKGRGTGVSYYAGNGVVRNRNMNLNSRAIREYPEIQIRGFLLERKMEIR
jgi:hypothetical protein